MSKNDIAIKVDNVSKDFVLPHQKQDSLKSIIIHPFNRTIKEKQKALHNVSLEVKEGEFFGVVGRNGSGKSTLLKILAGVYEPTKGNVEINGSLVPFIELGVGFNPDLTGRDNVYLNASLLGFSRKEVDEMYDEIVEFAELEKFMDQKLKNYSSGMQVRLAFSIAIRARSDILLLDEVIAVGDEAFQKKCFSYFDKLKKQKKTVVLVTHDMGAVEQFCTKAALIDKGVVKAVGDPMSVVDGYREFNQKHTATPQQEKRDSKTTPIKVVLRDKHTNKTNKYISGEEMNIYVDSKTIDKRVQNIGIAIFKNSGEFIFGSNTIGSNVDIRSKKLIYKVRLDVAEAEYNIVVTLFGETQKEVIDRQYEVNHFSVFEKGNYGQANGLVRLKHSWTSSNQN